jgi:rhodanese-related sulfurtransferase
MSLEALLAFARSSPILSLAFVGLSLALVYNEIARLFRGYQSLTPAALTTLLNRDGALLVDVSAAADFEKGHIAGARSLVLSQFDPAGKLLAKAKEQPVALVCRNGQASAEAAQRLVKAGFSQVRWLDGGVAAWQQANLPLVRGRD